MPESGPSSLPGIPKRTDGLEENNSGQRYISWCTRACVWRSIRMGTKTSAALVWWKRVSESRCREGTQSQRDGFDHLTVARSRRVSSAGAKPVSPVTRGRLSCSV